MYIYIYCIIVCIFLCMSVYRYLIIIIFPHFVLTISLKMVTVYLNILAVFHCLMSVFVKHFVISYFDK